MRRHSSLGRLGTMKEEIPESFWEALVEVKDKDIENARELFLTAMELSKKYKDERDEALRVLGDAQETKPHHWESRALTAERERDEALNVLREINDWINVAVMRPPTPNEAADAINTWGDKIRPILEVTE